MRKSIFLVAGLLGLLLNSTLSFAHFRPDTPEFVISATTPSVIQRSGDTVVITGKIKTNLKPNYHRPQDLREILAREGVKIRAFYDGVEVTSQVSVDADLSFSYSASVNAQGLNVFSLLITDLSNGSEHLLKTQVKLEVRIARFTDLLSKLIAKGAHPKAIEAIQRVIVSLRRVSDRITAKIAARTETLASLQFALMVENNTPAPSVLTSVMDEFKFLISFTPGASLEGTKASVRGVMTNLKGQRDSYVAKFFFDGVLLNQTQPKRISKGQSIEFNGLTPILSTLNENIFAMELYEYDRKLKDRVGKLEFKQPVAKDTVRPEFVNVIFPGGGFYKLLPQITGTLRDSFGLINPAEFRANIVGTRADGQALNQDVSAKFQLVTADNGHGYTLTGDIGVLPDGVFTLTLTGKDLAGNSTVNTPQFSFTIDNVAPILTTVPDHQVTKLADFQITGEAQDLSPVTVTISHNGNQIYSAAGANFSVNATLIDGTNTFLIKAVDAASNEASMNLTDIVLDKLAPVLTIQFPPPGHFTNGNVISYSGTSNEPLAALVLNGSAVAINADKVSFSGTLALGAEGDFALHFEGKDSVDNVGVADTFVRVDRTAPVVQISSAAASPTRNQNYPVTVAITEANSVRTFVRVNGNTVFESTLKNFTQEIALQEGANTVDALTIDAGGNQGFSNQLSVALDSVAPQFLAISPSVDTIVQDSAIAVSGQVNEKLARAEAHLAPANGGAPIAFPLFLTADKLHFSTNLVAPSFGDFTFTVTVADEVGNERTSPPVQLTFSQPNTNGPTLVVDLKDGQIVRNPTLSLPIVTNSPAGQTVTTTVTLNGIDVFQSTAVNFQAPINLHPGLNTISVRAIDQSGNPAGPIRFSNITLSEAAPALAVNGAAIVTPALSLPTELSSAFIQKHSASVLADAKNTNRTDPFACVGNVAVTPPANPLLLTDAFTEVTTEIQLMANRLQTADAAYFYVRDQIKFLPRYGLSQTAEQTLRSGYGTAADKATALISLYRAMGIPAQYLAGEILVDEAVMTNLLEVDSDSANDLAWAQLSTLGGFFASKNPSGFDPEKLFYYHQGKPTWHIPHVWVFARIETMPGQMQWLQIDPTWSKNDVQKKNYFEFLTNNYIAKFLFQAENGVFVKSVSLSDTLRTEASAAGLFSGNYGLLDLGKSVLNNYSIIPDGTISVNPACVQAQADFLPDEYLFKTKVRVGEATAPLFQASISTALARKDLLYLSEGATLRLGSTVLGSANLNSGDAFELYHAISEPAKYGGNTEARITPNTQAGGVQVIVHNIAPVVQDDLDDATRDAVFAWQTSKPEPEIMAAFLRLSAMHSLVRGSENDVFIGKLRNVNKFTESLVVAGSKPTSRVVAKNTISLGAAPSQATMDWYLGGPTYSKFSFSTQIANQENVARARGDAIVANSSVEHKVWEDVFGMPAVSSVKGLQRAAEINSTLAANDPGYQDLIQGEQLNATSAPAIFARFKQPMQAHQAFLEQFTSQNPYLYATTDSLMALDGWSGVSFIVYPSSPTGQGGAFLGEAGSGVLLGAFAVLASETQGKITFNPFGDSLYESWVHYSYTNETDGGWTYFSDSYQYKRGVVSWATDYTEQSSRSCNVHTGGTWSCQTCQYTVDYRNSVGSSSCTNVSLAAGESPQSLARPSNWPAAPGEPQPAPAPSTPPALPANNLLALVGQGPNLTPVNIGFAKASCSVGQPVNTASGAMWHVFRDCAVKGRTPETALVLERTYHSMPTVAAGDFGKGFSHNFETRIFSVANSNTNLKSHLAWIDEHGGAWTFLRQGDNSLKNPIGFYGTLSEFSDRFELRKVNGTKLVFFDDGRLKQIVERHGETIEIEYDTNNKLVAVSTGLAGRLRFDRNTDGVVSQVTRERDSLTYQYTYDSAGRLLSSKDFDNNVTSYEYNTGQSGKAAFGLMSAFTDPLGRRTEFTYYDNGQSFEQKEPGDGYRSFVYSAPDAAQRFTRVKDVDGNTLEFRFDAMLRTIEVLNPDGSFVQKTWNENDEVVASKDEIGAQIDYSYDGRGNLVSDSRRMPGTVVNYHSNFNIPVSINRGAGSAVTAFTVDSSDGDVTRIARNGLTLDLGYDAFGNVTSINNGLSSYAFTTDPNGLVTSIPDEHNPEARAYDSRGRVATRTFGSGRVLTYTYDNFDRVTRVDDTAGPSVVNVYDKIGRLKTQTRIADSTNQLTSFEWDDRDRLISITDALGRKTRIEYDKVALGCNVVDKPTAVIDPAGRKTAYEFDSRQRLIRVTDAEGGVTRYTYNLRGDLSKLTDAIGQQTDFFYDNAQRLVNMVSPTASVDATGQFVVPSVEATTYIYDSANRVTQVRHEVSDSGSHVVDVMDFTFDPLDRVARRYMHKDASPGDGLPLSLLEAQEDASFTYADQLDAVRLTRAKNEVADLAFEYEVRTPFALKSFGLTAVADPNAPPSGGGSGTPNVKRVNLNANDEAGNSAAFRPYVSRDGRYVAFDSNANNLVPNDTNNRQDVFVRDTINNTIERVSITSGGAQGTSGTSAGTSPAISGNGRYVLFLTSSFGMAPGQGGTPALLIRDRELNITEKINFLASSDARFYSISDDGRWVVFDDLRCGDAVDTDNIKDICLRDRNTSTWQTLSKNASGVKGNAASDTPRISADGRWVAFVSAANNLVADDTNGVADIFLLDRNSGLLERVNLGNGAVQANAASFGPANVSADGRYVVFASSASNLVGNDTNNTTDIFVRDRQLGSTVRVNVSSAGLQANATSSLPTMSEDAKYVSFLSSANNLLEFADNNGRADAFLHDMDSGRTIAMSASATGDLANDIVQDPMITGSGNEVAFASRASNLIPNDVNSIFDIFVADNWLMSTVDTSNPLALIQDSFTIERDATGQVRRVIAQSNNKEVFNATHDPAGRMTSIGSANFIANQTLQANLTYDGFGRKKTVGFNTGLNGVYNYDSLNRVSNINWSGAENISEAIIYDALTNNINRVDREFGTFTYGYDKTDQLTQMAYSGTASLPSALVNRTLTYDKVGNRINDTSNGAGTFVSNFLAEDSKFKYFPDSLPRGSLAKRVNKQTGTIENFSHRIDGKIASYSKDGTSVNYRFDALGRRVAKSIDQAGQKFTQTYLHLGDEDRVLLGKDGNSEVSLYLDRTGTVSKPDEHLAELGVSGSKAYITDHLDSVLNSSVGSAKVYGAHGELLGTFLPITENTSAVEYGWQGLIYDSAPEIWGNRARAYDQSIGRFHSRDPILFAGGDANLYRSRLANPLIYNDPSGTDVAGEVLGGLTETSTGGAVGSVAGGIIGGVAGSIIAPGAGTFVGGFVGGYVGGAIGESLDPSVIPTTAEELSQRDSVLYPLSIQEITKSTVPKLDPTAGRQQLRPVKMYCP